jgi:hypothetical protein
VPKPPKVEVVGLAGNKDEVVAGKRDVVPAAVAVGNNEVDCAGAKEGKALAAAEVVVFKDGNSDVVAGLAPNKEVVAGWEGNSDGALVAAGWPKRDGAIKVG